ncbi:hypothetical protein PT2222_10251 [Paraburkholderia tropica]
MRLKRQLRIELDFAQHDACAHLGDRGDAEDALVQEGVVGLDVGRDDLEDVIRLARGAVALRHLGAGGDLALKRFDAAFRVTREVDMRERADMQAELLAIEQRRVALDHARLLHVLDAAPARRAGQAHLIGDFLHRTARVELQQAQDLLGEGIECQMRLHVRRRIPKW